MPVHVCCECYEWMLVNLGLLTVKLQQVFVRGHSERDFSGGCCQIRGKSWYTSQG